MSELSREQHPTVPCAEQIIAALRTRCEAAERENEKLRAIQVIDKKANDDYREIRASLLAEIRELNIQLATVTQRAEAAEQRADRLYQDRYDLLEVTSTDGLSSCEWLMRTATAERKVKDLTAHLATMKQRAEAAEREIERIVTTPLATQLLNANHRLEEERETLKSQLATMTQERDELNQLFNLQHTRTKYADKLWQQAHNKPGVLPDLGELITWLLQQLATMTQDTAQLQYALEQSESYLAADQTTIARLENELCTAKDQIPPDMDGDTLSVALIKLKDARHAAQDEARRLREAIEDLTTGLRGSELHDVGSITRHLRQAITPPATEGT